MKVYVIRHKLSGKFMPARMFRTTNRGASWWEPGTSVPHDPSPRIFPTAHAARSALGQWLLGPVEKFQTQGYEDPYPEVEMQHVAPAAPRVREDMEIVECELMGL